MTEMKPYTSESITHLPDADERLRAREYLSQCNPKAFESLLGSKERISSETNSTYIHFTFE